MSSSKAGFILMIVITVTFGPKQRMHTKDLRNVGPKFRKRELMCTYEHMVALLARSGLFT